jgi:hypothetical protein
MSSTGTAARIKSIPQATNKPGDKGRNVGGLAKQSSILLYPFLWYGKMFQRVMHAISRRQELTADALASRARCPYGNGFMAARFASQPQRHVGRRKTTNN